MSSRLERLPVELLEQIFLECPNVNLPFTSLHLRTVLSSTHTKMAVVSRLFSTNADGDLEHAGELGQMLWSGSERGTIRAFEELQSRILACRWMTWEFLKRCREDCFVRAILRLFRAQGIPWPEGLGVVDHADNALKMPRYDGVRVKESTVRDFLRQCMGKKWIPNEVKDIKNVALELTSQPLFLGSRGPTPRVSIYISLQNGRLILGTLPKDTPALGWSSSTWTCPYLSFRPKIPIKLLHEPWTEDKLSFLYALNDNNAKMDLENETYRAIAKKGLTEAIKDDNIRAIHLIMAVWAASEGHPCKPKPGRTRMRPDTEHVKVAVIERGCRKEIVRQLLKHAVLNIDSEDPALVGWAKEKGEQGDGIGQWLLNKLSECRHRDQAYHLQSQQERSSDRDDERYQEPSSDMDPFLGLGFEEFSRTWSGSRALQGYQAMLMQLQ